MTSKPPYNIESFLIHSQCFAYFSTSSKLKPITAIANFLVSTSVSDFFSLFWDKIQWPKQLLGDNIYFWAYSFGGLESIMVEQRNEKLRTYIWSVSMWWEVETVNDERLLKPKSNPSDTLVLNNSQRLLLTGYQLFKQMSLWGSE